MNIKVRFSDEEREGIERLDGFEPRASYCGQPTNKKPREWGRIKHGDTTITFELWPDKRGAKEYKGYTAKKLIDKMNEMLIALHLNFSHQMRALDERVRKLEEM